MGAWLLGKKIIERFTPADWIWKLASLCNKNNISIFLLGGDPGVAEAAAVKFRDIFPDILIAGTHHGFFKKDALSGENLDVIELINHSKPNILLVGFGMPGQEYWIEENMNQLNANVFMPVGALFEYIAGRLPRGPRWMTQNALEWLARVVLSPKRYFFRYLFDIPKFYWRIIEYRFRKK